MASVSLADGKPGLINTPLQALVGLENHRELNLRNWGVIFVNRQMLCTPIAKRALPLLYIDTSYVALVLKTNEG